MLQERVEGRWLDSFRRVFKLNGIGRGTQVAILSKPSQDQFSFIFPIWLCMISARNTA